MTKKERLENVESVKKSIAKRAIIKAKRDFKACKITTYLQDEILAVVKTEWNNDIEKEVIKILFGK